MMSGFGRGHPTPEKQREYADALATAMSGDASFVDLAMLSLGLIRKGGLCKVYGRYGVGVDQTAKSEDTAQLATCLRALRWLEDAERVEEWIEVREHIKAQWGSSIDSAPPASKALDAAYGILYVPRIWAE